MNRAEYWDQARRLHEAGTPFVVVTVVATRGHAPQDPGAKAIVTEKGLHWGTVGGGKIEARSILQAREMLTNAASAEGEGPVLVTWNLQKDIGMSCGGEVTYLFERERPSAWKIVIFGAGHVAQALVRTLEPIECQLTCIDPRSEWIDRLPRSPKLKALQANDPVAEIAALDRDSYFVIMTQGHATDLPILTEILRARPNAKYVGAIGSNVKAIKIRSELKSLGISPEVIERLHCPIGVPFGTNHPAEIALSVAAQLLQVRDRLAIT
jgi:xanthine dehydrogenase accessory factor